MDMGQGYLVPLRLTPREDTTGTATGYYNIRAIERLLGPVVEWRDTFLDEMYPEGTTRLRHPAGICKGSEPRSKPGFS